MARGLAHSNGLPSEAFIDINAFTHRPQAMYLLPSNTYAVKIIGDVTSQS